MKRDHNLPKSKTFLRVGAGLLVAISLPVLASCTHAKSTVAHNYLNSNNFIEGLRTDGVQVIHLGRTYRFVIPSSQLFNPDSANLSHGAKGILNDMARVLNAHHIITVKVAAYADNVNAGKRKKALTVRQAEVVQAYLSGCGLKARLIYAEGQGDKNPVAWNGTFAGRHANNRVEISFRYIPKTTLYDIKVK